MVSDTNLWHLTLFETTLCLFVERWELVRRNSSLSNNDIDHHENSMDKSQHASKKTRRNGTTLIRIIRHLPFLMACL